MKIKYNELEIGDRLLCIDNNQVSLTIGNVYTIEAIILETDRVLAYDDNMIRQEFWFKRFDVKAALRSKIVNNILAND